MNFSKIINFDSGNARGLSVVLFVSGCSHHCSECHNPETWSTEAGLPFDSEVKQCLYNMIMNEHIENFVISGGDPFHPNNVAELADFLEETHLKNSEKDIICYTGYTLQQLLDRKDDSTNRLLYNITYLIDGPYDKSRRPTGLDFRGSYNQQAWERQGNFFFNVSSSYFKELTETEKNQETNCQVLKLDIELEEPRRQPKQVTVDYEDLINVLITTVKSDFDKTPYYFFNGGCYLSKEVAEVAVKDYFHIS